MQSDISFICPKCEHRIEATVPVPEPNWANVECQSDIWSEDSVEVECSNCGKSFCGHLINSAMAVQVILDGVEGLVRSSEAYYPNDEDIWVDSGWLTEGSSVNTYDYFQESISETKKLLSVHGEDNGDSLINKMIFVQSITAMEAYLGDSLIKEVMNDREAIINLLSSSNGGELINKKFNLLDIYRNEDLVSDTLRDYLTNILYHNLPKVCGLYERALDIQIPLDDPVKLKLLRAIEHRHDCVHRNGFSKNGDKLDVFTREFVSETIEVLQAFVSEINQKIFEKYPF